MAQEFIYKVIEQEGADKFNEECAKGLSDGWTPYSNLVVIPVDDGHRIMYAQQWVKSEETTETKK